MLGGATMDGLRLALLLLGNRELLNIWLRSRSFPFHLEALFALKKPTGSDLAVMLPSTSQMASHTQMSEMDADADKLHRSVAERRMLQQALCELLLGDEEPLGPCLLDGAPDSAGTGAAGLETKSEVTASAMDTSDMDEAPSQSATAPECAVEFASATFGGRWVNFSSAARGNVSPAALFCDWARQLCLRNIGVNRNVPPGLSDPAVLVNLFYCWLGVWSRCRAGATTADASAACTCLLSRFLGAGGSSQREHWVDHYQGLARIGGIFGAVCKDSTASAFVDPVVPPPGAALATRFEIVMMLYHVGISQQLKLASAAVQTQLQALAQLEELERRIATLVDSNSPDALQHLTLTKATIWEEVAESSRLSIWFKILLLRDESQLEPIFQACVITAELLAELSPLSQKLKLLESGGEGLSCIDTGTFAFVP